MRSTQGSPSSQTFYRVSILLYSSMSARLRSVIIIMHAEVEQGSNYIRLPTSLYIFIPIKSLKIHVVYNSRNFPGFCKKNALFAGFYLKNVHSSFMCKISKKCSNCFYSPKFSGYILFPLLLLSLSLRRSFLSFQPYVL